MSRTKKSRGFTPRPSPPPREPSRRDVDRQITAEYTGPSTQRSAAEVAAWFAAERAARVSYCGGALENQTVAPRDVLVLDEITTMTRERADAFLSLRSLRSRLPQYDTQYWRGVTVWFSEALEFFEAGNLEMAVDTMRTVMAARTLTPDEIVAARPFFNAVGRSLSRLGACRGVPFCHGDFNGGEHVLSCAEFQKKT